MLESLHISSAARHVATPPFPPSPSLRASSFRSSDGSITPLRRSSSIASIIPETDSSLDSLLKGESFKLAILKILIKLRLTTWRLSDAENLVVKNIASALTNSVYLIQLDDQKLLLRIYGPNVLHLIDREYEMSVLARLAHHRIGPRMLGQFKNGRIEQWLESVEVLAREIRVPLVSSYIARRLREFHDFVTLLPAEMFKVSATVNLDSWIPALPLKKLSSTLKQFIKHIELYRSHVQGRGGEIVFCHNDLQYGNLLRITGEEHNCLAVIDFEYAGPNPRAFDIANHFNEWMANYHESPSHAIDASSYPSFAESENFLTEYIRFGKVIARREDPVVSQEEVRQLRQSVDLWRAMSHAQWAIWGIVQALPAEKPPAAVASLVVSEPLEIATKVGESSQPHSHPHILDRVERKVKSTLSSARRRVSKTARSPVVQGMKSPFLSATPLPNLSGSSKRTPPSNKSSSAASYFPDVVSSPVVEEEEEEDEEEEGFTIGESAASAPAVQNHSAGKMVLTPESPACPVTDDVLVDDTQAQDTRAAAEWLDDDDGEQEEGGEHGFDYIAYSNERIGFFYGELLRMQLIEHDQVPSDVVVKDLPPSAFA